MARLSEGGSKGAAATAAPASHVYREVAGFELSLVQKREVKAIWEINQRSNRGLLPPAPGSYSNEFQIFKKLCGSIVDNPYVFGLMTILTLWALFGSVRTRALITPLPPPTPRLLLINA